MSSSTTHIAKNTLILYFRMFITMGVSLFTSRVVLKNLGIENYGIYTVVGGFVSLFSFLNGPLNEAASRFFAFEIGKEKSENLKTMFESVLFTHLFYAIVTAILLEGIGLYLVKHTLSIPPERMNAAVCIFHFSVISIFITIIQTPLVAFIIAAEKMRIYAYIGIFDAVSKLITAILIAHTKNDRLVLYAFLIMTTNILVLFFYHIYCKKNMRNGYSIKPKINITVQKKLFGFVGWTLVGNTAWILRTQGITVIFNIFLGVAVSAALGIANQVNGILNKFIQSFTIAIKPQITKSYASDDFRKMNNLIIRGAKYSFFLFFLIALPVMFHVEYLLNIWLTNVPEYTVVFAKLLIINSIIGCLTITLNPAINATGDIRAYQLIVGGTQLFNIPLSYLFLKLNYPAEIAFCIAIILDFLAACSALVIAKKKIPYFSIMNFVLNVFVTSAIFAVFSFFLPFLVMKHISITGSFLSFFVTSVICVISVTINIIFIGMNKHERKWFQKTTKIILKRLFTRREICR